jgi:hypothetical protein
VRKDALLGARLLLVAPGAAEERVELELLHGVEEGHGLVHVAALVGAAQLHAPGADRLAHGAHQQALAQLGGARVAERDHFGKVVLGVDVQQRERELVRTECLLRQAQHDDRVLAAGEEERGVARLCDHLAHDVDRLGFEPVQVCHPGRGARRDGLRPDLFRYGTHAATLIGISCNPHSFRAPGCSHHQRPARGCSPGRIARVHGSQPIEG